MDDVYIVEEVVERIILIEIGPQGPPGVGAIAWNEVPTGLIDGTNAVFGLAHLPETPDTLMLFLNGMLQRRGAGADYEIAEQSITFTQAPTAGDLLTITYAY